MLRSTSMRATLILATTLACVCGYEAAPAVAADPQLRLPAAFDSLQREATESVNVTLGQWPLSLASWALGQSSDPKDKDLREVLMHVDSITIRTFKFARDYDHSAVDRVRQLLSAPEWNRVIQVRNQGEEAVDIFVMHSRDTLNGLAVLACKPRELTIVNIVGSVDPAKLASVMHHFGGPDLPL
jgi:hypothetical protein